MGNTTLNAQPRTYLPVQWLVENIPAGVTTPVPISIFGDIEEFPMPRKASIITVGFMLSEAVTNQYIGVVPTVDGSLISSKQINIDSSDGRYKVFEFAPGKFVFGKGTRIGFAGGSHPGLLPAGSIDLMVIVEIQPEE